MSDSEIKPKSVEGTFHPPASARAIAARLTGSAGRITLIPESGDRRSAAIGEVTISARVAGVPRRIEFDDGAAFVSRDDAGLEAIIGAPACAGIEARIARLERPSIKLFVFGSLAVLAIVAGLRWGVPAASGLFAALTPRAISAQIGAGALATIDRLFTEPTKLGEAETAAVSRAFDALAAAGGLAEEVTLNFRHGGDLGANAFAMPGGVIVVTDQLIAGSKHTDEVAGVLAHELAHAEFLHPEQAVWQTLGFGLALTVMFGDAGTLAEEAATAASIVVERSYSRAHESEADLRAVELMSAAGFEPGHFVIALDRLHAECGPACKNTTWLSSHPGGDDRLSQLCNAIADPGPAAALCAATGNTRR